MTKRPSLYVKAHLVVAAVRILEHRTGKLPSVEEICELTGLAAEDGYLIGNKLAEMDVIEWVEGAYGARMALRSHLNIENIPRDADDNRFEEELKKFHENRRQLTRKIEDIQTQNKERKKNLFAEIERQLKEGVKKKEP